MLHSGGAVFVDAALPPDPKVSSGAGWLEKYKRSHFALRGVERSLVDDQERKMHRVTGVTLAMFFLQAQFKQDWPRMRTDSQLSKKLQLPRSIG